MRFEFNTFNHGRQGRIIVEDITAIMGAQLSALGHEVGHTNGPLSTDATINVVLEAFDNPEHLGEIIGAYASGARLLIVATEEPSPKGFNLGLEPAMIDRQNAFPAIGSRAEGILHLVPGMHVNAWYSKLAPSAPAELGHAPELCAFEEGWPDGPSHDFGFFGKMTWRREQMLARLEEMTGRPVLRITTLDVPRLERNATMRRAKVIVQIRANEEWGMVSSTRCASALSFGRPIVAEPHPAPAPWDEVVTFSKTVEEFFYDAIAATKGWRDLHAAQFARFKSKLTPEACIGGALRQIGLA